MTVLPPIPNNLCGFRGCVFTPHPDSVHSWTPRVKEQA